MSFERLWKRAVFGDGGASLALLRAGFCAIAPVYGAAVRAYHGLYLSGLRERSRPVLPTISVGSIAVGGSGKTTVSEFLAQRALQMGLRPAIVLRGYGGRGAGPRLVSDGRQVMANPAEVGDEAVLLARRCSGAVVAVGKQREAAIELAAEAGAELAILDDGMQYLKMQRDREVAVFNAFHAGLVRLLPAGVLREPASALRRADEVWITYARSAPEELVRRAVELAGRFGHTRPVLAEHRIVEFALTDGGTADISGRRVLAFCGIGSPEGFAASLRQCGPAELELVEFDDHHPYSAEDVKMLQGRARQIGAELAVTTEKDWVRLERVGWSGDVPLAVARCALEVVGGGDPAADTLQAVLGRVVGAR